MFNFMRSQHWGQLKCHLSLVLAYSVIHGYVKMQGLGLFDTSVHSFISGLWLGPAAEDLLPETPPMGRIIWIFPADTALGRFTHILVYTASPLVESTTPASEQQQRKAPL